MVKDCSEIDTDEGAGVYSALKHLVPARPDSRPPRCVLALVSAAQGYVMLRNRPIPSASGGAALACLRDSHVDLHRRSGCLQSSGHSAAELSHLHSLLKPQEDALPGN